jgi:hypothetical protein
LIFTLLKLGFFLLEKVIYRPNIKFNDKIFLLRLKFTFFTQKFAIFMTKHLNWDQNYNECKNREAKKLDLKNLPTKYVMLLNHNFSFTKLCFWNSIFPKLIFWLHRWLSCQFWCVFDTRTRLIQRVKLSLSLFFRISIFICVIYVIMFAF